MIVVDVETTGLNPKVNCIASIGAVCLDPVHEPVLFYMECRIPDTAIVSSEALEINGFTEEELRDPTKMIEADVFYQFNIFCNNVNDHLLAGHNIHFDVGFLKKNSSEVGWKFGYRYVDLHSIAYSVFGRSLSLNGVLEKLGMEKEPEPHNALRGAILEAECISRLVYYKPLFKKYDLYDMSRMGIVRGTPDVDF